MSDVMGQKEQVVTEVLTHESGNKVVNKDILIPVSTAYEFKAKMEAVGSRCDVSIYKNQGHGFFNPWKKEGPEYNKKTILEVDGFLRSIGYLKGKPNL